MPTNAELTKEIETLCKEIGELKSSLTLFNELYESIKENQEALVKENKDLGKRNQQLTERVAALEQYSRLNNVEIRGVPVTKGEDCSEILKKIGEKVNCPITSNDLDVVHRVPAKKESNIIVRFCSREKKAEFAAKARKARLTTESIGMHSEQHKPVDINDHLTPENKRLFAQALELKKEKGWQFLWVQNCRILARKSEDSRVFRISGPQDLHVIA